MINFVKKLLSIADSSIIALLIFILQLNPIKRIEPYLPEYFSRKLADESYRLTINTAIILLIFEFIKAIFKSPIGISANLNNLDGTTRTNIHIGGATQRPKKLNLDLKIEFKNNFIKWIINFVGGIYIFVENTKWTTIQAEKNSELFRRTIDDNTSDKYICIDINKFFGENELEKKLRININILSNEIDPLEGSIYIKIGTKSRKKIIDWCMNLLIDYEECRHDIQSSSEVI